MPGNSGPDGLGFARTGFGERMAHNIPAKPSELAPASRASARRLFAPAAQRPFLDRHHGQAGDGEEDHGDDEHPAKGSGEVDAGAVDTGERLKRGGLARIAERAEHDRAEHRDDEGAAELAEEVERAGR